MVFAGFLFGLNNLYWYYESAVRTTVEIHPHLDPRNGGSDKTNAERRFGTVGSTFITMFFALYTLGESDDAEIRPFINQLTPFFGYILFGMFHIANITILISMLIAMMTKSFDSILVNDHAFVCLELAPGGSIHENYVYQLYLRI